MSAWVLARRERRINFSGHRCLFSSVRTCACDQGTSLCVDELWDYTPLCRYSTSTGNDIGSTQHRFSCTLSESTQGYDVSCTKHECLHASMSRTPAFEHGASPLCRRVAVIINCCAGIVPRRVMLVVIATGIGCQQHRRWCSRRSICLSPCFRVSQRKESCFVHRVH